MLVKKYLSKTEIPAGLESFYVEQEGTYVLHTAIATDREEVTAKIAEFRENNTKLLKQNQDLNTKLEQINERLNQFDGIDPEKVKEAQEQAQLAEELGLKKKGDFDALKTRWTEPVKAEYDKKLSAATKQVQDLTSKIEETKKQLEGEVQKRDTHLSQLLIENEVTRVATEKGARPEALQDILLRATTPASGRTVFKLVNGEVRPFKGEELVTNQATGKPQTISEWAEELQKAAPHLFQENRGSGAGAGGSGGAGNSNQTNPWRKSSENLTAQAKILKENPALAKVLKAQAAGG